MTDALSLLTKLASLLDQGKKVVVHCRQGVGRSGLVAAGLLMTSGMSAEKAIETVSAARTVTIPETPAQLQWIRRLPSDRLVLAS
jgi:protein-tyrosine phosphatase